MNARHLGFGLVAILSGCALFPFSSSPGRVDEDPSIVIPSFFDRTVMEVGTTRDVFSLDGKLLSAIQIAADDFLPSGRERKGCWARQEFHRYQVIRQGQIIFVRIDEDLASCGLQYIALDTGVTYAINEEGRILRRVFDAPASGSTPATQVGEAIPAEDSGGRAATDAGTEDGGLAEEAAPSNGFGPLDGGSSP